MRIPIIKRPDDSSVENPSTEIKRQIVLFHRESKQPPLKLAELQCGEAPKVSLLPTGSISPRAAATLAWGILQWLAEEEYVLETSSFDEVSDQLYLVAAGVSKHEDYEIAQPNHYDDGRQCPSPKPNL